MDVLATIGQRNVSTFYVDRPTVKVVIRNSDNEVLILNNGLLPGGGVDAGESDDEAITRELREELGVTVEGVQEIGTIIQYRNFLGKRYVIHGYEATLETAGGMMDPQDEGEVSFVVQWLTLEDAIAYVTSSIERVAKKSMNDDANQGKLYNLTTTLRLLKFLMK